MPRCVLIISIPFIMPFLGKNMAAHVKVGILGLALNPKRWTIGRLTSKAGEGREIEKGLPRLERPNNNINHKQLRSYAAAFTPFRCVAAQIPA